MSEGPLGISVGFWIISAYAISVGLIGLASIEIYNWRAARARGRSHHGK